MDDANASKAEQRLEEYKRIAAQNKDIDLGKLAISAIVLAPEDDEGSRRKRRWAYLISISLPPVGLLIAAYYFFSGRPDGRRTAAFCVFFTVAALLTALLIGRAIQTPTSSPAANIPDVNISDIKGLLH